MSYTWDIEELKVNASDVVIGIYYRYVLTDGEDQVMTQGYVESSDGKGFDSITMEEAVGIVESAVDVSELQASLTSDMAKVKTPDYVVKSKEW